MALLLKAARINANKTQTETAKHIGKTVLTVQNYEAYKSAPNVEIAIKIAKFYGVGVDDIIWSK